MVASPKVHFAGSLSPLQGQMLLQLQDLLLPMEGVGPAHEDRGVLQLSAFRFGGGLGVDHVRLSTVWRKVH